jgi:hypothetical protein
MNYAWQNIIKRIDDKKETIMAEVGVFKGHLSERLLTNTKNLTMFLIDAWDTETYKGKPAIDENIEIYQQNCLDNLLETSKIAEKFPTRAFIIKGYSTKIADTFEDKYFDIVYIDAAHDFWSVLNDINAWRPKVKNNGWICGHDYGGKFTGVKEAVDLFPDNDVIEIDSDYTWFVRVKR